MSDGNGRTVIRPGNCHGEVFLIHHTLDASTGYPYDKGMDFEWHPAKAEENVRKYGIDFPTAVLVFLDPHRIEREDIRISYGETRFQVIGMVGVQVLVLIYTPRADRIRIVSARKANRRERRAYDTGKTAS
jgi:uncharacterized protein